MSDEELENIIEQTINGAISTIPAYMDEIKENKETLKVENPKEFVYGMVMGMALGISGAILSAQKEAPTPEDQIKVRDAVNKNIHQIRERIFKC
jgi:translation initiation factor 2B subunit (eIF-2B alpha/beta/delta family)